MMLSLNLSASEVDTVEEFFPDFGGPLSSATHLLVLGYAKAVLPVLEKLCHETKPGTNDSVS